MNEQTVGVHAEGKGRRLGLALSGGGFRASFFHLGVLARMAEMGLLRHMEAISTVSGGSIIGALYYLRLRELLMTEEDAQITDGHYVDMVAQVESDFLAAVQKNLRMRTFVNPLLNMKMALPSYSRSDRIGEIYDSHIYRAVFGADRDKPIEMRELKIYPKNNPHGDQFNPTKAGHNDNRRAKVPILLINSTTLNTAHNWRFLASRMGEQPHTSALADDIDKNTRLRRGEYDKIVKKQQDFPLGIAVAASAGVPGLFPPLSVTGMYKDLTVQLVDGGVYDNLGIAGLEDPIFPCTHFVISDASGQMEDVDYPDTNAISVLGRVMNVLMDRVREEMVQRLEEIHGNQHVAFFHLTRGLEGHDKPYLQASGGLAAAKVRAPATTTEEFGVNSRVQHLLARVRTDLDSFTDTEAFALMADGYLMSEPDLQRIATHFETQPGAPVSWRFLKVRELMADPNQDKRFLKQLEVASQKFLKPFRLGLTLKLLGITLVALVVLALYVGVLWKISDWLFPGWLSGLFAGLEGCLLDTETAIQFLLAIIAVAAGEWVGRTFKLLRILRYPAKGVAGLFTRFLLPALGAFPVYVYLKTLDKYFVDQGRLPE
jgi:NTE family protein